MWPHLTNLVGVLPLGRGYGRGFIFLISWAANGSLTMRLFGPQCCSVISAETSWADVGI